MSEFTGRTAMVTGAAGGIGSATALEFRWFRLDYRQAHTERWDVGR
ncbi:MAG TPA: hypothetical protein VES79_13290 [Solirubrobacteraceae bacterium]|nr:hypothetical protein [Solirubrobacteraceae bacterium]